MLIVPFVGPAYVAGQYEVLVKRASVQTTSGVVFTAWVDRTTFKSDETTTIFYEVENRSNQAIHLVRSRELQTAIKDDGALFVRIPLPIPVGHGEYNYVFTRVGRGNHHRGKLIIPKGSFNKADRWSVDIAFGFVTDVRGLNRQLRPNEDPAGLRGLLRSRIEMVGLGLTVDVEGPER